MTIVALTVVGLAITLVLARLTKLRGGRLKMATPRTLSYAAGTQGEKTLLGLPFALYNTGAVPLIVEDVRLSFDPPASSFKWSWTRDQIQPDDKRAPHRYAEPFAVHGRSTEETCLEFVAMDGPLEEGTTYTVCAEIRVGAQRTDATWKRVGRFRLGLESPLAGPSAWLVRENSAVPLSHEG